MNRTYHDELVMFVFGIGVGFIFDWWWLVGLTVLAWVIYALDPTWTDDERR